MTISEDLRLACEGKDLVDVLVGRHRMWWLACARAVREEPAWLVSEDAARCLSALRDAGQSLRVSRDAEAILAAARAAAGVAPHHLGEDLDLIVRRWRGSRALPSELPPDERLTWPLTGNTASLLTALATLATFPAGGARTTVALILALLYEVGAETGGRVLATHVLFDADPSGGSVVGAVGRLELVELAGGPPGLFPDPRYMSFFHGDRTFQQALTAACGAAASSTDAEPNRCVLWRLLATEPEDGCPVSDLSGDSAGAAFATLLTALALRQERARGLRRVVPVRILRGRVAVSGTVNSAGKIGRVEGLAAKLTVAGKQELTPILPAGNRDEVGKVPGGVEPFWVATVDDAYRRATQWPRAYRRFFRGAVGAALLATIAAGTVYWVSAQREEIARQEKVTVNLTGAAREQRDRDPGLAAILAAQAVAQAPGDKARAAAVNELIGLLAYNGRYAGAIIDNNRQVTATAVIPAQTGATEIVLAGTDDGQLFAASRKERTIKSRYGRAHFNAGVTQIAVSPVVPSQFASGGLDGSVEFWRLVDGKITSGPKGHFGGRDAAVWSVAYSPDGVLVATGDNEGWVRLFAADTGALIAQLQPHTRLAITPAAITAVAFGPSGSGTLYAGTAAGRLVAVAYGSKNGQPRAAPEVSVLPTPARGAVRALALTPEAGWYARAQQLAGTLLIGTDQGLATWDLDGSREAVAFPANNITGPIRSLSVNGMTIAVGQDGRTYLLEHSLASDPTSGTGTKPGMHGLQVRDVRDGTLASASLYDGGLVTPVLGGAIRIWEHDRRPLAHQLDDTNTFDDVGIDGRGTVFALTAHGSLQRHADGSVSSVGTATSDSGASATPDMLAVPSGDDPAVIVIADTKPAAAEPLLVLDRTSLLRTDVPDQEHLLAGCDGVSAAVFLPSKPPRLAIGCKSGLVQLWDPGTWRAVGSLQIAGGSAAAFALVSDTLIVGGQPSLQSDDIGTLTSVKLTDLSVNVTVPGARGGIVGLVAAGDRVIAGGADGTIRAFSPTLEPLSDVVTLGGKVWALAPTTVDGRVAAAVDHNLVLLDPQRLSILATATVGQPIVRLASVPGGGTLAGRTAPVIGDFAIAGGRAAGSASALLWHLDPAALINHACALSLRDLTAQEVRQYSGEPTVRPQTQCSQRQTSAAASPTPPSTEATSDGDLVAASGPVRPRLTGCQSLLTNGGNCDTLLIGEHDYAWTVTTGPPSRLDDRNFEHRMVLYRGTDDGTAWVPVLRTADSWSGVQIYVWPMTRRGGETTLAIGHRRTGRIEKTSISLVTDGRIEKTISDVYTAAPTDNGLQIWAGVYTPADSDCCPSNWVTYMMRRNLDGTWSEFDREAVPREQVRHY